MASTSVIEIPQLYRLVPFMDELATEIQGRNCSSEDLGVGKRTEAYLEFNTIRNLEGNDAAG